MAHPCLRHSKCVKQLARLSHLPMFRNCPVSDILDQNGALNPLRSCLTLKHPRNEIVLPSIMHLDVLAYILYVLYPQVESVVVSMSVLVGSVVLCTNLDKTNFKVYRRITSMMSEQLRRNTIKCIWSIKYLFRHHESFPEHTARIAYRYKRYHWLARKLGNNCRSSRGHWACSIRP